MVSPLGYGNVGKQRCPPAAIIKFFHFRAHSALAVLLLNSSGSILRKSLSGICSSLNFAVHSTQMRAQLLIAMIACFQFGCSIVNPTSVRAKLDDAVKRYASIDERIMDWGAHRQAKTEEELMWTKCCWCSRSTNSVGRMNRRD